MERRPRQIQATQGDMERFVGRLWIREQFMTEEVEKLARELEEARREIERLEEQIGTSP